MTKDHFVPLSHGGRKTVIACNKCNKEKADMSPGRWFDYCLARVNSLRVDAARHKYLTMALNTLRLIRDNRRLIVKIYGS